MQNSEFLLFSNYPSYIYLQDYILIYYIAETFKKLRAKCKINTYSMKTYVLLDFEHKNYVTIVAAGEWLCEVW